MNNLNVIRLMTAGAVSLLNRLSYRRGIRPDFVPAGDTVAECFQREHQAEMVMTSVRMSRGDTTGWMSLCTSNSSSTTSLQISSKLIRNNATAYF